jgi:hypothetical protein
MEQSNGEQDEQIDVNAEGAYTEHDTTFTTLGFHHNCPNRRFVGAVSVYLCNCSDLERSQDSENVEMYGHIQMI